MKTSIRAAAVQFQATEFPAANLLRAEQLVAQAAGQGAELVVLPELFHCTGPFATVRASAEPIPGPAAQRLGQLAARWGITLCAGSLCEQSPVTHKAYNTSLVFSSHGEILARYRKQHLFDVDLPGQACVRESDYFLPGETLGLVHGPVGVLGLAICYDLRFPELFREQVAQGMEILLLPAAFTRVTGRDHWEVLLRARAIENQVFVVAANQCGDHLGQPASYGNSLILDPWGRVLARASDHREEVIYADLNAALLADVRARIPALKQRRL